MVISVYSIRITNMKSWWCEKRKEGIKKRSSIYFVVQKELDPFFTKTAFVASRPYSSWNMDKPLPRELWSLAEFFFFFYGFQATKKKKTSTKIHFNSSWPNLCFGLPIAKLNRPFRYYRKTKKHRTPKNYETSLLYFYYWLRSKNTNLWLAG